MVYSDNFLTDIYAEGEAEWILSSLREVGEWIEECFSSKKTKKSFLLQKEEKNVREKKKKEF